MPHVHQRPERSGPHVISRVPDIGNPSEFSVQPNSQTTTMVCGSAKGSHRARRECVALIMLFELMMMNSGGGFFSASVACFYTLSVYLPFYSCDVRCSKKRPQSCRDRICCLFELFAIEVLLGYYYWCAVSTCTEIFPEQELPHFIAHSQRTYKKSWNVVKTNRQSLRLILLPDDYGEGILRARV